DRCDDARDIELARLDSARELRRAADLDVDGQLRKICCKARQQLRQLRERDRLDHAETDPADEGCALADGSADFTDVAEHPLRIAAQRAPARRDLATARRTLEQANAKLGLELGDALRHRRRRRVQFSRCALEASELEHRDESLELLDAGHPDIIEKYSAIF